MYPIRILLWLVFSYPDYANLVASTKKLNEGGKLEEQNQETCIRL